MPRPADIDHAFGIRVAAVGPAARVYCRNHAFDVGSQASLRESDPHPSAVEQLLGALGGDLVCGLRAEADRRRIDVDAIELTLSGRLDNILVHLGVIGEEGHPGLATVTGTLYARADCDGAVLAELWSAVVARSPLHRTLSRAADVRIELRVMP